MSEFKNGDKCIYKDDEYYFIGLFPIDVELACVCHEFETPKLVMVKYLTKPMSDEEKAGKELFDLCQGSYYEIMGYKPDAWERLSDGEQEVWIKLTKKVTINK